MAVSRKDLKFDGTRYSYNPYGEPKAKQVVTPIEVYRIICGIEYIRYKIQNGNTRECQLSKFLNNATEVQ